MTAQVSDAFVYLGQPISLVGINGSGLFDPAEHGLEARMTSTACWRGFVCTYEVKAEALHLAQLEINLSEEQNAAVKDGTLTILGRSPSASLGWAGWQFEDLGPMPFSGGLLLGDRFISELYVHMGFHPAWKYEVVHELSFEAGRLTQASDRSAEMAEFRAAMKDRPLSPDDPEDQERLRSWIESTFSREYRW